MEIVFIVSILLAFSNAVIGQSPQNWYYQTEQDKSSRNADGLSEEDYVKIARHEYVSEESGHHQSQRKNTRQEFHSRNPEPLSKEQWSGPKKLTKSQVIFEDLPSSSAPVAQQLDSEVESLVKPSPAEWIFGRNKEEKLNLISWLIDGCYFYTDEEKVRQLLDKTPTLKKCPYADKEKRKNNPDNISRPPEFQTFDGFFNNPLHVELGTVDTPLLRRVSPVYKDGTYEPVESNRVNPFDASKVMERKASCTNDPLSSEAGPEACGSKTGKTAFLVYFGQQVVEEILDSQRPGCPPEYFNVPIPKDHEFSPQKNENGKLEMPFLRSRWAQNTGHSPGNPRQQLNEITSWIDGGLVYGTAKGWADVLRTRPNGSLVEHGLLASIDDKGYFPVKNTLRLPLANPPPPAFHSHWVKRHETANVDRFFVLGNPRGNENAFLLSFGVMLFRWHNLIATYLHDSRPEWGGERVFQEARKWVIGTYQHIAVYDWLPEWLGEPLTNYEGYDPSVDPQIEQFFQTAAMRFGHTLVTPGGYIRDYTCAKCKVISFAGLGNHRGMKGPVRTCNIFWRPQEPLLMDYKSDPCVGEDDRNFADIDRMLMGLASQKSEREDNMIVEDLRGRVFGPLEFSRRDLMAVNIQRGRDHGTPDYNTARAAFGLKKITSVEEFMLETKTATPMKVVQELEKIHKGNNSGKFLWDNIDVWTGGILETTYRPGPLFRAIIKDQFIRIRNADRFWFENKKWKKERFSSSQIERIKTLKVFDMVVSVTKMLSEDIQENPFKVPGEDFKQNSRECFSSENSKWQNGLCYTFDNTTELPVDLKPTTCYHFPQLDSASVPVEPCEPLGTYDYFEGSDISFIVTYSGIGIVILVISSLVPIFASFRHREREAATKAKLSRSVTTDSFDSPISAREYLGSKQGTRGVVLVVTSKGVLDVRSHKGELLRSVDLSKADELDLILVNDGKHVVVKNPKEYDCVFSFEGKVLRTAFVNLLKQRFHSTAKINETTGSLHQSLASALTKEKRLQKLENFFKLVFAQAFSLDQPKGEAELVDPKLIREVIKTELTQAEFASALRMETGSQFIQKMFDLIDRDNNGYISFREFLDMLIIFAKGTAEEKTRLMFEMYDIDRSGFLSREEFKNMIRSMVEAANADVDEEEVEKMTELMLKGVGPEGRNTAVSLQEFHRLMSEYKDTLGYAQLNFSGVNVPESKPGSIGGKRRSRYETTRATVLSIYGMESISQDKEGLDSRVSEIEKSNVTISHVSQGPLSRWIEINRLQLFWGVIYTLLVIAIFLERAYVYSFENEHGGLRRIAGYGVTVTRGAASAMMFIYATLLLTMCRNIITRLRETFLHRFIPFDSFISMHKYIAILGLFFMLLHIIGHSINFYHISTQTASDLSCIFRDYHRPTHVLPKFHYWAFGTVTGLSGILLTIHASLIYAFATNYARAFAFRMFWTTHNSYILWYILMLVHGSGRLVQEPLFFNFLCGPLVIFVMDKLVSAGRKQIQIPVLKADILPSNVTKLEFAKPAGFEYKSGQWVRIASTALSANEFHPFTLSSAPHEPHLSCHIRAVGPFTANIRQIYERSLPKLFLDGPYGEGHQDWWRYDVSILVGGGIGVTPFASILKDVVHSANPRNCKKIYFLWVTRTQKQFEWLVDIIRDVEEHKLISVHLFITQIYNKFDLRTVLLYIFERHFQRINNRSLFTGLKSTTHFGRPNFLQFFKTLRTMHPNVSKFGVFSCGPFPMTKMVDEACLEVSNLADGTDSIFQHHFENF